jgi:hypothetical protein
MVEHSSYPILYARSATIWTNPATSLRYSALFRVFGGLLLEVPG